MLFKAIGVGAYLAILLAIGVIASRRMKDVRDYFAAGKRLGFWAVAFSSRATGESAWLLLGLTGMGAAIGVKAFWVVAGEVLGVTIAWFWMSRRFKRLTDRYDSITIPDYLERRFGDTNHALRIVSAVTLVVFVTIYVSAQIDATGKAFESFLGVNYFVGALVGFLVVMAYTTSGGFVAVVWSDVFQGSLMVAGLVLLPIVGLASVGGVGAMADQLRITDPSLLAPLGKVDSIWLAAASTLGLLMIGLGFLGSPQVFVRFLALRSENEIGRGALVAIAWTILADAGAVLVGLVGRAILTGPGDDVVEALGQGGQDVLPKLVAHTMPALIVGLYIAIVLSAIMSTVDSLLVLASSALVRDGYQKVLRPSLPDDALVKTSRRATFALSLCALAIALTVAVLVPGRTVFWFVIFGWSGIAATFCPTMILSLAWRGMTRRGAMASMIVGFAGVPFFKFAAPHWGAAGPLFDELSELPPSFALALVAGVAFSLTDPRRAERVKEAAADLEYATSCTES